VNTPPEWRESVKLGLAGFLVLDCWGLLGWVLASQFLFGRVTAEKIEAAKDSTQVALIKDAHQVVDQAASLSILCLLQLRRLLLLWCKDLFLCKIIGQARTLSISRKFVLSQ
jgi:hypothetical protein